MWQKPRLYDINQDDEKWSQLHQKVKAEELAGQLVPVGTYLSTQNQPPVRSGISHGPRKDAISSLSSSFLGPEETMEDVMRERRNVLSMGLRGVNHSYFTHQDTGQHDAFDRGHVKYMREGSHLDGSFQPSASNGTFIGGMVFRKGTSRGGNAPFRPPIAGGMKQLEILEHRELEGRSLVQTTTTRHLAGQVVHSSSNFGAVPCAAPDFPLDYHKMPLPEKPRFPPPLLRNPHSLDPEDNWGEMETFTSGRTATVPTGLSPQGGAYGGTSLKPRPQPQKKNSPVKAGGMRKGRIGHMAPRPPPRPLPRLEPLARYPAARGAQNGYGPIATNITNHHGGKSHFHKQQGHQ